MRLNFEIIYDTVFGEDLMLNVIHTGDNGQTVLTPYHMTTQDGHCWMCQMEQTSVMASDTMDYYYSVNRQGREERREWMGSIHRLDLTANCATIYTSHDQWTDMPDDSFLYSSAFTDCIHRHEILMPRRTTYARTLRLRVKAPQLRAVERLAVIGDCEALGRWEALRAIDMTEHQPGEWTVDLDADALGHGTVELKFVGLDEPNDVTLLWETGANRRLAIPAVAEGEVVSLELPAAHFEIPRVRLAGTLVPLFSLRTAGSFGVGDFGDLKRMTDLMAQTGQRVLQLLPVNDTTATHTWRDSYPYNCVSVFALHPQYVDLRQLPALKTQARRDRFERLRQELNALAAVDYERVNHAKDEYLHLLFAQEGKAAMEADDFRDFFQENKTWLEPYALYCHLRDSYGTPRFADWPDHNTWDEGDRKALGDTSSELYRQVAFYYYEQYVLDRQLRSAHHYARVHGVVLKGDVPIGVSRQGCDAWWLPRYFHMDGQAGAPPDDFSRNGQNWGFPTYDWDEMLKDGCRWWAARFRVMARYFDAYRLDHVLGFFRIWQIPISAVHGLLGQFSPALGLTRQEIEAQGLAFREELFTQPYIADWTLARVFGSRADEVKRKYLVAKADGTWRLRPDYATQRKIEAAFAGKTAREDIDLRDGLYALSSSVLFLRDYKDADKYHPRICAQRGFVYQTLSDADKQAFDRIYDDYFYHRNNQFWYGEAMKKLPRLVGSTRMLACAEDLGMVPECVGWVMRELHILSLEIQSMPKEPGTRFGHLSRNPYLSVCTISTHDMPTLRQWWDEDRERTQSYWATMLYRSGDAPHPLPGWLARDIVSRHLTSPSMLCILSVQDWLSIDETLRRRDADSERVNVPANPDNYWRYRLHLNIEDISSNAAFVDNVKELVRQADR